MTNFEKIKELDFENMVSLLVWGRCFFPNLDVPTCDKDCPDYGGGRANGCPYDKQEIAVREWLESEVKE